MIFNVTARQPDGRIKSYRFNAADRAAADSRAQELCDAAGIQLIRVTRMGSQPNIMEQWV